MGSGQYIINVQEFEREWLGWQWQQKPCVLFVADVDGERVFEVSCGPDLDTHWDTNASTTAALLACRSWCDERGISYWISTRVAPALKNERLRQLDCLVYGS